MSATLVYSSEQRMQRESPLSYTYDMRDYILASKLIDAIIMSAKKKKGVVAVERNRFTYIPTNGNRKMTIRLKRFS